METIKFFVPNISCGHCAHTIKMELSELEGVKLIDIDVAKKEVNIEYTLPITREKIESLLAEINYPVEKAI